MSRLPTKASSLVTELSPLEAYLKRRCTLEGPLTIADYMADVLGHPDYGYYKKGRPFGAPSRDGGDFITAPEISQIFGELIGLCLVQAWYDSGKPKPFILLEFGPGRGVLMADLLRAAKLAPEFLDAAQIRLVETSPKLRDAQAEMLSDYEILWAHTLAEALGADGIEGDTVTEKPPLFFVANEFFDALPIRQCEKTEIGWRERVVTWSPEEEAFGFALSAGESSLLTLAELGPEGEPTLGALGTAPLGSILEISPDSLQIVGALGNHIADWGGAGLIIDYGYGQKGALGDTLQAVKRHAYVSLFETPGEADLTAHVDFYALSAAARQAGAQTLPLLEQGQFLLNLGAKARLATLQKNANPAQRALLETGLKRLIDAQEMGSLFKVLGLTSGIDLAGFPISP